MKNIPAPIGSFPRSTALPEMATAVLICDEDRIVEYLNASAIGMFEGGAATGRSLDDLLSELGTVAWENSELEISSDLRVTTGGGRALDGTLRRLSAGGYVLSLDDVTSYIRSAQLGNKDALTDLANRAAFADRLSERLAYATRHNGSISLLYLDLDRFKPINDTLGHPIGDALLRKVAGRLRAASPEADLIARLGGDEFAVLVEGDRTPARAETLAGRLVDLVSRTYVVEGHVANVGVSIGIATAPDHGLDSEQLLRDADLALYAAKAAGRGVYKTFNPSMDERARRKRDMEIELRRSLALKELHLVYQPQVAASSLEICGFEALVRWRKPSGEYISPHEFVALAEEVGLATVLGDWVIRSACFAASEWPSEVTVSVNVSPLQFRNGDALFGAVQDALFKSGLPAHRLKLEITESSLIDNSEEVLRTLERLRRLGLGIGLDDFGTGYSSLSYLWKYRFHQVKIDRSFVQGIDEDPTRAGVVRAIADMARELGMTTVAEGVETHRELACVRASGCDQVQGFLTGKPMSVEATKNLLMEARG